MTVFYLDTSVLIKRYRTEDGTVFVDTLYELIFHEKEHKLTTSALTMLEVTAALRRILKGGVLTLEEFEKAMKVFSKESDNILIRPLDEEALVSATHVIMDHALRTADAIHLATALEVQNMMHSFDEDIILLSNDKEMCKAAEMEGLEVISAKDDKIAELRKLLAVK